MSSRKLVRARELLQSLKREVETFLNSKPYRIGTKRDDSARLIYYLSEVKEVPRNVPTLAGEILQNLRSALDHKAYELFQANSIGVGRHIYFPIDSDRDSYEASKVRRTMGMSKEAKDFIDSIKPYREGNRILWQIHELNILDKHRALVSSGSAFKSMDIGAHVMSLMADSFADASKNFPKVPLFIRPADNLFPLSEGKELFIDSPNAKEISGMQFMFQVVINEPGIAEGDEIIELLDGMTREVEKQILNISNALGI